MAIRVLRLLLRGLSATFRFRNFPFHCLLAFKFSHPNEGKKEDQNRKVKFQGLKRKEFTGLAFHEPEVTLSAARSLWKSIFEIGLHPRALHVGAVEN